MIDVDFLITTRSAVEEYRNVRGSLKRKIVEEGKVLYGASKTGYQLNTGHFAASGF